MKKILFLIMILFLIIVMIFLVNSVNAIVCCEKLKSGANYCVDNIDGVDIQDVRQCDTDGFKAHRGQSCKTVDSCKNGCCVYTSDGICANEQRRVVCDKNEGFWTSNNCNNVDSCKNGCCFLGTNTFFSNKIQCSKKAEEKGISFTSNTFATGFKNDGECRDELDKRLGIKTMGCCISPGGCNYLSKDICTGDFKQGEFCMDVAACKCETGYKCVNGKEDVYKVSSCGDEKVEDDCDGINNICGLVKDGIDESSVPISFTNYYDWRIGLGNENVPGALGGLKGVGCIDINCIIGNKFIHDKNLDLIRKDEVNKIIIITPEMLGGKDKRLDSESWCVDNSELFGGKDKYEYAAEQDHVWGSVILEQDKPGNRYYVYRCDEGRIIVEACDPSRLKNGICKGNEQDGFSEAKCVDNTNYVDKNGMEIWSKTYAKDHPDKIEHPPSVQFYPSSYLGYSLGGLSFGDSCGYCSTGKWYKLDEKCKENKCYALGDCSFDKADFSFGGCVKGALAAEVMWLTAGSIAAIGPEAGIGSGSFANSGWGGLFGAGGGGSGVAATETVTEGVLAGPYAVGGTGATAVAEATLKSQIIKTVVTAGTSELIHQGVQYYTDEKGNKYPSYQYDEQGLSDIDATKGKESKTKTENLDTGQDEMSDLDYYYNNK